MLKVAGSRVQGIWRLWRSRSRFFDLVFNVLGIGGMKC